MGDAMRAEWKAGADWLIGESARRLSQAVESMTGEPPKANWVASEEPVGNEAMLWWEQPLNIAAGAIVRLGAPEATWLEIGTRSLKLAGIEEVELNDARGTYLEIQSQALGALAQALSTKLGGEVVCEKGREVQSAPADELQYRVELALGDSTLPPIMVGFSASLLAGLNPAPPPPPAAAASQPAETPSEAPNQSVQGSKTLDLLLEVELPVSVSFGRAQLPLKDVIKLSTGSIVELNRSIIDPVEVIVNNCVIARGEVVVIEGNYGVRVTQIISRQERLRTLK
jgi:flagellar motor switch protein FliN